MLKKKEASLLVYLLLSLSICGCNSSQETDQSKECLTEYNLEVQAVSATNLDKGQVTNLDKKQDIKYSKGQIAPLSDADFMLTNGKKQVALNDLFDEVDVTMEENAFLYGDDSTGVYYRHYKHEEPEYSMIVSNAGYDLSDEPIYTFYIEQLNIEDPSFKTARDITLGDSREKVEVAYGKGVDDSRFNYDCRKYSFQEKSMSVYYDEEGKVESLVMGVDRRAALVNGHTTSKYVKPDNSYEIEITYVHPTLGYEIDIPKAWEGQYAIEESDLGVTFVQLVDGKKGMNIIAFTIKATEKECEELPDWPYTKIMAKDGLVYSYITPGDSQYDIDTEEGKAKEEACLRLLSFKEGMIEHFRFSANAPKRDEAWYRNTLNHQQEMASKCAAAAKSRLLGRWKVNSYLISSHYNPSQEQIDKFLQETFIISKDSVVNAYKVNQFSIEYDGFNLTNYDSKQELENDQQDISKGIWYIIVDEDKVFYLINDELFVKEEGLLGILV